MTMALVFAAALAAAAQPPASCDAPAWPQWETYATAFVSGDGRVIDRTAGDRTTSEGQSYALFFALVANDRARFDRLLAWTQDNLSGGDPRQLPAWLWGRGPAGRWGVVDPNPASDADLWMAYALLEAGRLWGEPRYTARAQGLLANVVAREVLEAPGVGPLLLPAPKGFVIEGGRAVRLNPSYTPPQLLRRFAAARIPGPWPAVLKSSVRTLRETTPRSSVADWVLYRFDGGFAKDPVHGATGSYDAIRAALWIGMLPAQDPLRAELAPRVEALLSRAAASGAIPERLDAVSGAASGKAPPGFAAALLPLAHGRNDLRATPVLESLLSRSKANGLYGAPPAYYDQNLALFGVGFAEGWFRFDPDGSLRPAWERTCRSAR